MKARSALVGVLCGLSVVAVAAVVANGQDTTRTYVARYVDAAPVIDGIETTPGEWDAADQPEDVWTLLRSGVNNSNNEPDETNNRFVALWNDDGLYIQHQVDYGFWEEYGYVVMNWNYENLNLYFDPNLDGETNRQNAPSDSGIDAYQLSFNQPVGETALVDVGTYVEAHVNATFGNQGAPWSNFDNVVMKQITSKDPAYGYTELFIPWADFNATNPDLGDYEDTGLYHPNAPLDGEQWYFNIARNEDGQTLPAWVAAPGKSLFAQRPHGILQFSRSTTAGDFNGDGLLTGDDIDTLTPVAAGGGNDPAFDLNDDGLVDVSDVNIWVKDLKHTWIGDANLDGEFNSSDFVLVFIAGKYEIDELAVWSQGDWDADGRFGTSDFVAAFVDGGYEQGPRAAVRAVPEPSTCVLLLLALAGWSLHRGRSAVQHHA